MNQGESAFSGLTFDWSRRTSDRGEILGWVILAIAIHVAAYFAIRATYPAAPQRQISNARLYVAPDGSEFSRRFGPMIAAENPALFAPERTSELRANPSPPPYRPSFETSTPPLQPLPVQQKPILPPIIRDTGPVFVGAGGESSAVAVEPPATETQVVFSGQIGSRRLFALPPASFTARPGHHLSAAEYVIAVSPAGQVVHIFERWKTESPEINRAIPPYLMRMQFEPIDGNELTWGTATIHWGTDVERRRLKQ